MASNAIKTVVLPTCLTLATPKPSAPAIRTAPAVCTIAPHGIGASVKRFHPDIRIRKNPRTYGTPKVTVARFLEFGGINFLAGTSRFVDQCMVLISATTRKKASEIIHNAFSSSPSNANVAAMMMMAITAPISSLARAINVLRMSVVFQVLTLLRPAFPGKRGLPRRYYALGAADTPPLTDRADSGLQFR